MWLYFLFVNPSPRRVQKCVNSAGGYACKCNAGYELYAGNGTAEFYIPETETGERDGDTYRVNKTCVPKLCPPLSAPENGVILTNKEHYRFGDTARFDCDFGYVMAAGGGRDSDAAALECTSSGQWNGTVPECVRADCDPIPDDVTEGLQVASLADGEENSGPVTFGANVSLSCVQPGKPLRRRASAGFRQCVYDPRPGRPDYWMAGAAPACPRIDCGQPPLIPGADYAADLADTRYRANFFFGCKDEAFRLVGQSSQSTNIVTCMEDGVWDFGNLRCEGPVCEDPLRPPDGDQISDSYEQGSKVREYLHRYYIEYKRRVHAYNYM